MNNINFVFVTTNNKKEGQSLAKEMVKKRLAACVSILPNMRSIYEWDGEIQDEEEYLLIIKTTAERIEDLKYFISKNHSYEVPEFVVFESIDALPDYLDWINKITS
ncbi:MAG: divalent-cation tolerance protein CutA [Deltaproteobacteria bacterium CG07_land_8_20_14_0_80_38_7]|nr:MAG: divalent-cation tolerance protein CutA [Deltaproteobacteria bacterium CG07_land_8_20_14_0_80_38_7]